jgi:formylglycine-generating enzyme required for sulfatase activity
MVRCPRCDAPITGDYKFCPACALRLKASPQDAPLPAQRSRWKTGFLVASVAAGLLLCALVGILLFHPSWIEKVPAPAPPPLEIASLAEPPFTVASIPENLQEIPPGYSYRLPLDAFPSLPVEEQERLRTQYGENLQVAGWISYPMRVLRYEVTRGQYAEFVADVEAHRDRIPHVWLESDQRADPRDVDVFEHIPESWVVTDSDGAPVSWSVAKREMNLPVAQVSYVDALGFCEWASARLGLDLRIPFAMEWMRAARAGDLSIRFPWGNPLLLYACNNLGSFGRPQYVHFSYGEPLPGRGATKEDLYAMAGNLREYALDHDVQIERQIQGPPTFTWRPWPTTRNTVWGFGGSFRTGIEDCTVESKQIYRKSDRENDDVGFRVIVRDFPR